MQAAIFSAVLKWTRQLVLTQHSTQFECPDSNEEQKPLSRNRKRYLKCIQYFPRCIEICFVAAAVPTIPLLTLY